MSIRARAALLVSGIVLVAGCTSAATPAPTQAPTAAPPSGTGSAPASAAPATPIAGGLLDKVIKAGVLTVSTDPNYAPQSVKKPDGTFEGFDIDVATEVAKRLGVKVAFVTPDWSLITAGSWSGRWDASVGSMTITADRQKVLDFSPPYYYTPAQMTASKASGITTIDGLAGKSICAGEATTYLDWLSGKKLDFGTLSPTTSPPAGIKTVSLKTDALCPQTWASGRNDFQGWLSSSTTVDGAIKSGLPVVKVGDPVYFEPLAIAVDKSGPPDTDFMAALTKIVNDMHSDGTLKAMSQKWFGADLTQGPS
ncbi:MAG TPA: transporter substrate-binding domain-containing protein [Candidatus Binatia bacterium]|nr:transporter substrate-binding domain-containing protein [Candidatus Binatia bacterium]